MRQFWNFGIGKLGNLFELNMLFEYSTLLEMKLFPNFPIPKFQNASSIDNKQLTAFARRASVSFVIIAYKIGHAFG